MKPEVILFGLDGATYTVMNDLIQHGVMPHLERFMREGVRAKMVSTVPPLTPPAWSTLVTGRSPGHHGILGFVQYADAQSMSVQLVNSRMLKAETIWSMVNRHGKRAGSLNFVGHQPAPKIDGWVIPGWVSWRWMKQLSHPPGIIEMLKSDLPGFDLKRLALDFDEEKKAIVGAVMDDYTSWIVPHIEREQQWFNVLCHMMEREPAELVGVVFDGVDKLQHLLWSSLDPALAKPESEEYVRIRGQVWEYFRSVDEILGETVRRWGDQATILICSDHGFTGSWEILYLNTWLEHNGFLTWKPNIANAPDGSTELDDFDLFLPFVPETTKAFVLNSSSNGIFIHVKGKRGDWGIQPEQYESFRKELTHALLTRCADPETGEPLIKRVHTREEIFDGPHMENAPDLTVTLRDHGFVSTRRTNTVYAKREIPMGTHHPDGILIARGRGIRRNRSIDRVSIMDVAPTALYAMHLPVPADLQGRVVKELYTPQYMAEHPIVWGSKAMLGPAPTLPPDAPEEDVEVLEKMKALGYLE
ncbi:MAG: alkaline phosphatase family protein [Bryobacterales bacterium]|nr:alkaline phosphatase family protein [Bryobacterales bacterium]